MHLEVGRFTLTGGELDVVGHWLERILRLSIAASADLHEVTELRSRVLTGLEMLRSGHVSGSQVWAAAEDAIAAALALGFHHSGGPADASSIERAVSDTRKQGTATARAKLALEPWKVEGAKAKAFVQVACYEAWEREPTILDQRAWVKTTIQRIYDRVIEEMRPHITADSKWASGCRGLEARLKNHVRAAAAARSK